MKGNGRILTAAALAAFSLAGCGGQKEQPKTQDVPQAAENQGVETQTDANQTNVIQTGESQTKEEDDIWISFLTEKEEYKAEDGTVLFTVESVLPTVWIVSNTEAAKAINEYVQGMRLQGESVEEVKAAAEEDYRARGKENWSAYSFGATFSAKRADDKVISFVEDYFSDMGGAHPNSARSAYNFSTQTGSLLKLEDIVTDQAQAVEAINAFLLEETKKEEYQDMLFEDYESSIGSLLTDTTWYLAEDGFHIIGNEYIISPHAAGILDFAIPYEQADFLKGEYSYKK